MRFECVHVFLINCIYVSCSKNVWSIQSWKYYWNNFYFFQKIGVHIKFLIFHFLWKKGRPGSMSHDNDLLNWAEVAHFRVGEPPECPSPQHSLLSYIQCLDGFPAPSQICMCLWFFIIYTQKTSRHLSVEACMYRPLRISHCLLGSTIF